MTGASGDERDVDDLTELNREGASLLGLITNADGEPELDDDPRLILCRRDFEHLWLRRQASKLPDGYLMLLADDSRLERFVAELELKSPFVVGHSHGGKIACHFAAKNNPCAGLVLIGSSGVDRRSYSSTVKVYFYKAAKHLLRVIGTSGERLLEKLRNELGSRDYQEAGTMRATLVRVVNEKLFSIFHKIT